jgi:hypothetical protein
MSILAQHGFGKGQKIQAGLKQKTISGVVFSPRDEEPSELLSLAKGIRSEFADAVLLMDPQVYASTVQNPHDRHLPEYPYYSSELRRASFTTRFIEKTVKACFAFQKPLPLTYFAAPAVSFATPEDGWSQVALQFAEESIEQYARLRSRRPLLVSLVLEESALASRPALDDLLDSLTTLDCTGFYVCLVRNSGTQYGPGMVADRLANLLYVAYALGEANEYEVILGYTDWIGVLLHAVGVKHCASGWSLGLRHLQWSRFEHGGFGRQPKERYSSVPLLNSVFLEELDACWRAKRIEPVLSGVPQDKPFTVTNPLNVQWPQEASTLQHWAALSKASRATPARALTNRIADMEKRIEEADAAYVVLMNDGIQFSQSTGPTHLQQWKAAIVAFREAIS